MRFKLCLCGVGHMSSVRADPGASTKYILPSRGHVTPHLHRISLAGWYLPATEYFRPTLSTARPEREVPLALTQASEGVLNQLPFLQHTTRSPPEALPNAQ